MSATDAMAALEPDARAAALAALDDISRPLDKREIDRALAPLFTRTQRIRIIAALLDKFTLIALVDR